MEFSFGTAPFLSKIVENPQQILISSAIPGLDTPKVSPTLLPQGAGSVGVRWELT